MGNNKNYPMDITEQLKNEIDNVYSIMRGSIVRDISLAVSNFIMEHPEKNHFSVVCSEDLKNVDIIGWDGYINVACPHCSKEFFEVPWKPGTKTVRCNIYKNFFGNKGKKVVVEISEKGDIDIIKG